MVAYSGSTKPGFSGNLYLSNGVPIGMHLGVNGRDNYGYSMNFILSAVEHRLNVRSESTAEYLLRLVRGGQRLRARNFGMGEIQIELPSGKLDIYDRSELDQELIDSLNYSKTIQEDRLFESAAYTGEPGPAYVDRAPEAPSEVGSEESAEGFRPGGAATPKKKRKRRTKKPSQASVQPGKDHPSTSAADRTSSTSDSQRRLNQMIFELSQLATSAMDGQQEMQKQN
jgi:hypothetical protein